MAAVPPETPVTTPVDDATVATAVLLLLQVPVPVGSLRVKLDPGQTGTEPVMAAGLGFTETVLVAEAQPTVPE